ncbi:hypothetical protein [Azonexus sp.]|uniref:hypothetical protein n=1 Tax=Azonexus sp. TaxID=1872668 RepID=UPI0027BA227D|nr:hypothetical protein [Azonexus sp.]
MAHQTTPLQIFKPGRHAAMSGAELTFSDSDVAASAAAYDPALFEAPLVVGHPQLDAPAYGWVKSLGFADGALEALPQQVDPAFAEMVAAGRFKKISASFFHPAARNNPVPGVYYLRHVGFLGAQAPAVKGLRTPEFASSDDDSEIVSFEFSTPVFQPAPQGDTGPLGHKEASTVTPEEKAALEAENAQLKKKVADAEAETKRLAQAQIEAQHTAFAEGLIGQGKLLPADKAVVVATMNLFANESLSFSDGDGEKALLDGFKDFLNTLPPRIEFAETATAAKAAGADPRVEFAAPQGYGIDQDALATHQKALAYQAQHQCDYPAAVRAVMA